MPDRGGLHDRMGVRKEGIHAGEYATKPDKIQKTEFKIEIAVGIGIEKEIGMAFGH
jgi:hypothetical protein